MDIRLRSRLDPQPLHRVRSVERETTGAAVVMRCREIKKIDDPDLLALVAVTLKSNLSPSMTIWMRRSVEGMA